jgi:hypothetical protein
MFELENIGLLHRIGSDRGGYREAVRGDEGTREKDWRRCI